MLTIQDDIQFYNSQHSQQCDQQQNSSSAADTPLNQKPIISSSRVVSKFEMEDIDHGAAGQNKQDKLSLLVNNNRNDSFAILS